MFVSTAQAVVLSRTMLTGARSSPNPFCLNPTQIGWIWDAITEMARSAENLAKNTRNLHKNDNCLVGSKLKVGQKDF